MNDDASRGNEIQPEKKEYELPPRPILPSTYPNAHDVNSNIPISSDLNVEYAKEWVDYNIKWDGLRAISKKFL